MDSAAPAAPPDASPSPGVVKRHLRLVTHQHAWSLLTVEYDQGAPVTELQCSTCGQVTFR